MDQLYREAILDHYKFPRHKGHLDGPDVSYHDHNPFCGDEITLELRIVDGVVTDAAFDGRGCAISQASASMMTEEIVGKKAIVQYGPPDLADMRSNWADVSKARAMLGWEPQVGLREGITHLFEWYRAEREWAKDIVTA